MAQVPVVAFIEMAVAALEDVQMGEAQAEIHELRALGTRLRAPMQRIPGRTDLEHGYLLGLQVARTLLATMPAAIQAGVTL